MPGREPHLKSFIELVESAIRIIDQRESSRAHSEPPPASTLSNSAVDVAGHRVANFAKHKKMAMSYQNIDPESSKLCAKGS